MSTTPKNDGGPAFPTPLSGQWAGTGLYQAFAPDMNNGMSLRDWFAGQALAGLVARVPYGSLWSNYIFTSQAYQVADAMLAGRAQLEAQP